jgi:ATP-dependent exoDNAse (exonuclease V) alpha subunit
MITRELLYTAVTRAKESIHIIGEPDILERGITKQVIVGNTLAAKAEYFKGKASSMSIEDLRWN